MMMGIIIFRVFCVIVRRFLSLVRVGFGLGRLVGVQLVVVGRGCVVWRIRFGVVGFGRLSEWGFGCGCRRGRGHGCLVG